MSPPAGSSIQAAPPEAGANKRREIIEAAAQLFGKRGYKNTAIRDIAEAVGLLSGSLYYHIRSKEELFLEVHHFAMDRSKAELRRAAGGHADPWERLRSVCIRHVEMQCDPRSITVPLMADLPVVNPALREAMIAQRDEYELYFREMVAALPLPEHVDRGLTRLLLLTLLNNVVRWYRPGGRTPEEIGAFIYDLFRGLGAQPPR